MKKQKQVQKEKCQKCEKKPALKPHACPYHEEIYNDSEWLCNCCEDCAYECAMDI